MSLEGTSLEKLKKLLDETVDDYLKALGGNKAAGTRARSKLHDIKLLAHDIKKELIEIRKKG